MLTVLELDALSQNIQMEIKNKVTSNFAKVTTDNIVRALHVLAEASKSDKVQIAQEEIAIQLKLSQNRVSELLKLAKKAGLISIDMICRCGDVRNEYTLLDNPIIKTIKRVVFKSSAADSKESIELALDNAMIFYRLQLVPEHILEEVKRRIPVNDFKKASGVFGYFIKTLKTVKRLLEPTDTTYRKPKKSSFNDYNQRPFDPSLEDKLLEITPVEEVEEEPFDTQAFIKRLRE
jgi:hypothetical protein